MLINICYSAHVCHINKLSQASNLKNEHSFVYTLWVTFLVWIAIFTLFLERTLGIFCEALWFNVVACFQLYCLQAQSSNNQQQRLCFISSTLIILTPEIRQKKGWIFNEHNIKAENKLAFFLAIAQWLCETLFTVMN